MNKGLIRLTLALGLAATLGACGGETAPSASPSPAGGGDTTPPPVSSPATKESPKSSPDAGKTPAGGSASPASPAASPKKP
jgi:hypothetical protein